MKNKPPFKITNILWLMLTVFAFSCSSKNGKEISVYKAQKGTFQIEITEEGDVNATNSINISTPNLSSWRYGNLKISSLVTDGSKVEKGDTVVTFDPSEVNKAIVESESSLEINQAELERTQAQHESEIKDLMSDYQITKINKEISQIKFENSDYYSEIERKKIKLNLEKAEIELEKALEQIENRKKIQREEIAQKKLSIEQARSQLEESKQTLNELILVSQNPGIVIIAENWSTNAKYQIGDQCWSGQPLVQLPDLSELKATVKINEVDISKIKKGLKVEIRPDAFSGQIYHGKVVSVANLAVNKERNSDIKVFPVEVLITDSTDNKLMPGLTVSCKIIIDEINDVMFVPLEAVFSEMGQDYVYVKSGGKFKRQDIKTAQSNNDFVIVEEGLEEGDEVALVDPFAVEEDSNTKTAKNKDV
ncbi:efflux RND transporter periplasmic adaptor subunit [Saccharicrinis sp. FJH54]|uniref:efflux RND transporter periplasmic adaptor subunit n=1 Tax=Saccharicrinis sp. FJH54 TaxID=3344665 RepID=UPI0035D41ACF